MNILFLSGWAHPSDSLRPLALALSEKIPHCHFELLGVDDLVAKSSANEFLTEASDRLNEYVAERKFDVIVAWSLAGMIALEAVAKRPEIISRLVIVSSTYCFVKSLDASFGVEPKNLRSLIKSLGSDKMGAMRDFYNLCQGEPRSESYLNAVLDYVSRVDTITLLSGLKYLQEKNLKNILPSVSVPTCVLHGREDNVISVEAGRALDGLLPNSSYLEFAGSHGCALRQVDFVSDSIVEFLRQ